VAHPSYKLSNTRQKRVTAKAQSAANLLKPPLTEPLEDVAQALFFHSYLDGSKYAQLLNDGSLRSFVSVSSAVQAAALAYLSTVRPGSPAVQRAAKQSYCRAISETNAALANTGCAIMDATLLAVLLLGLFESFRLHDAGRSRTSWLTHIHGAVALLRLRGVEQLATCRGRALFGIASHNVRISCLQRGHPVPGELRDLAFMSANTTTTEHDVKAQRVAQAFDRLVAIRVALNNGARMDAEDIVPVVHEVQAIDRYIVAHGPKLEGHGVTEERGATDAFTARTWLSSRLIRLFLNNTLMSLTLPFSLHGRSWDSHLVHEAATIHEVSRDAASTIAAQISVAIPSFLDSFSRGASATAVPSYLLWPLRFLANPDFCPPSVLSQTLDRLGELSKGRNTSYIEYTKSAVRDSTMQADWYGHFLIIPSPNQASF
jgi:hypothetical protein